MFLGSFSFFFFFGSLACWFAAGMVIGSAPGCNKDVCWEAGVEEKSLELKAAVSEREKKRLVSRNEN